MAFKIDTQTISDLNIIGKPGGKNIYELFNNTKTSGGAKILKGMFLYPCTQEKEITARVNTIQFFKEQAIPFPFNNSVFDLIDFYISDTDERTRLPMHQDTLKRKLDHVIGSDTHYQQVYKGVTATFQFLVALQQFHTSLLNSSYVADFQDAIKAIIDGPELAFIKEVKKVGKFNYTQIASYDELFRFTIRTSIIKLLHYAYQIDVFIAVAEVSTRQNFVFATINHDNSNSIELKGVYHPLVNRAIGNDISIDQRSNMIFLTGANMAGKSTFMKTFSIAIYLAHIGFPVPAKSMNFSIQNGMFTTINLADNLNMGYSHFYAEVSRVKKVAEAVNKNERLIVVFDELFRGTNVKDAYEATVAVMAAFANKRECTFIISTHIIEAGADLKLLRDNIKFLYLPTVMKNNVPHYTYTLKQGITNDRHGMLIIKNEQILDILNNE